MSGPLLYDRVYETSSTSGTGTLTLLGAKTGYQSFAVVGNANTCYYTVVDPVAGTWEVGTGTYTASGTTLSRTTVLSSSNSGSLVSFAANTKDVFISAPAALFASSTFTNGSVYFSASGIPSQNNANFFWDNAATQSLRVGTATALSTKISFYPNHALQEHGNVGEADARWRLGLIGIDSSTCGFAWGSNAGENIAANGAGIGNIGNATRTLSLYTSNGTALTERWRVDSNGHLIAGTDTTYDIGASGANRPRNVFVGSSVVNKTKAGTPTDSDVTNPADGMCVVDTTGVKVWFRCGGAWKGVVIA